MKDYDTAFIAAEYEHDLYKQKKTNRRHNKKRAYKRNLKKTNLYFGYYVRGSRPIYEYQKVFIPETTYRVLSIDDNGNLVEEEKTIGPKEVLRRKFIKYEDTEPYLKRFNISGRRTYAKKMTNKRIRQNKVCLNKTDFDILYNSSPGGYRRAFDYAWEIY